MSDNIVNAGGKGKFMAKIIIGFIVFIMLWASIYYANFALEFDYPMK